MPGEEILQIPVHVVQADRIDRGHHHATGNFLMQLANFIFQLVVMLHDLPHAVVVSLPLGSQNERASRAIDQLHVEPLFQLMDHLARSRLRDAILVGCPRETTPSDNIAEYFERL